MRPFECVLVSAVAEETRRRLGPTEVLFLASSAAQMRLKNGPTRAWHCMPDTAENPIFCATAALTMAVGGSDATRIFSVTNAVLLLPFHNKYPTAWSRLQRPAGNL